MPCGRSSISQLNCFDTQQDQEDIDILRQRGQDELRGLIFSGDQVNWKAVMATAYDLQLREEAILKRQEMEDQRRREKEARGRTKIYDRFGPVSKLLPPCHQQGSGDSISDEMSTGLLSTKDENLMADSVTSQSDSSDHDPTRNSSTRNLNANERLDSRTYFITDVVSF